MAKYKFRLSYKNNGVLIPIELNKIEELKNIDITDIKEIDSFTTKYDSLELLITNLKLKKLVPDNINELFVTIDKKDGKNTIQQLYTFNKTLFFSKDKHKLFTSYGYRVIKDNINNGEFLHNIIKFYVSKYPHKNFRIIEGVSYSVKRYGYHGLTPTEYQEFEKELEYFINYIFTTKNKDGIRKNDYKKLRGFLCFVAGEHPIKMKSILSINKEKVENYPTVSENDYDEYENEEFITYEEYKKFNREFISNCEENDFEPYRDGNDWIAPISRKETYYTLNENVKKLCKKKDNGEYE